jgi:hypothetical protein
VRLLKALDEKLGRYPGSCRHVTQTSDTLAEKHVFISDLTFIFYRTFISNVRKIAKRGYKFRHVCSSLSVCLLFHVDTRDNLASNGRIFMKVDI